MPRNIGPRPLPDPQFDLHRRRQCRRACDPHRPAPQNRRTPGGGLCRPFWPHSGGVHPPDGRKQRLRPLALSAGGTRRRTRRSDHRTRRYGKRLRHRRRRPDNGASCSASWDSSVRQTPFPPTATSSISATRKKGPAPALRNSPCTKASNSRLRPARSPAKIRRSEKRLPRPTSGPMPKMQSN